MEHRPNTTRVECFSDGVMAIVVTLMIFEFLFVTAYGVATASAWLPQGPRVSLALYVLVLVLSFLPDRVHLEDESGDA